MARIVVTGAKGQLGKSVEDYSQKFPQHQWLFCDRTDLDITKTEQVQAVFQQFSPTHCINCAAFTNVALAEKQPQVAVAINAEAVKELVAICKSHDTTLIHVSTDYVFDGEKTTPYTEEDPPNPINVYGKTKAVGEQFVLQNSKKGYVVRSSWLYAKTHGQNFYQSILKKAIAKEPLKVVNDQVGTPTSTDNLARFLIQFIVEAPAYGLYHYAGKKIQSWHQFAQSILHEHQLKVTLEAISTPEGGVKRPKYSPLISLKNKEE